MPVLKTYIPNFSLTSRWKCKLSEGKYVFDKEPTFVTHEATFGFCIPSGAVVRSAKIYAKITAPDTGYSIRNVNGNQFRYTDEEETSADVHISEKSGVLDARFCFKANGELRTSDERFSLIQFKDVYLAIDYDESA